MSSIAEIGSYRLEKVLFKDKKENPKKIESLLKSDLYNLFENYMEIKNINIDFKIENGFYQIKILALAQRMKIFGTLPE